jgi:hypothetical protein
MSRSAPRIPQQPAARWRHGAGGQSLKILRIQLDRRVRFWTGAGLGSNDGRHQVDAWAKNVGYSDQKYQLDYSKAGEHYFTFGWDQIPHVYSTSAQTLYNGVGSTRLTLPPGLSNQMFTDAGCLPGPAGCAFFIAPANAAKVQQDINSNTYRSDIGIRRDTARWTTAIRPTTTGFSRQLLNRADRHSGRWRLFSRRLAAFGRCAETCRGHHAKLRRQQRYAGVP